MNSVPRHRECEEELDELEELEDREKLETEIFGEVDIWRNK